MWRLLIAIILRSDSLGIVVVVNWLSISIVVVHWNLGLSKRDISGFCSTNNYQFLCRIRNRSSIVDDLVLMMILKMLISEQSIVCLSATRLDAACNKSNQKKDASDHNSCDLTTIQPRVGVGIITVISTVITIGANVSLQFRLMRLLSLRVREFPCSSPKRCILSCSQEECERS